MTPEAVLLAIVNAGRPAGIAAVYALLSSAQPRRLLLAYTAVGFAWSSVIGVLIVSALGGVDVATGDSIVNDVFDVVAGVALIGFAGGLATGRLASGSRGEIDTAPSRLEQRLHNPSLAVAAGAGVLTHLPGLLYLLGLNAILATGPGLVAGVTQVLIFNAIWFATPIAALVMSIRRPVATRRSLGRLTTLGRRHGRSVVIALSALVGAYFALRGAIDLLG